MDVGWQSCRAILQKQGEVKDSQQPTKHFYSLKWCIRECEGKGCERKEDKRI